MVGKAGENDDVARVRLGHLDPHDALEEVDLSDLAALRHRAVGIDGGQLGGARDRAGVDAADREPAEIIRVVDVRHDHLEGGLGDHRRRHVRQDRVQERPQVSLRSVGRRRGVAQPPRAVEHREVEVLVGRREGEE
jgi:hypothetical protein